MIYRTQIFVILADTRIGSIRHTRHNASSAMCLADDLAEAGYRNVRIINPDGIEQDRQQFRNELPLVKRMRRRARALA